MGEMKQKGAQSFKLELSKNHGSLNHLCHEYNVLAGQALLKHCNLDRKDDKMPLVQWKLLEQQHVILPQEIPRLSF